MATIQKKRTAVPADTFDATAAAASAQSTVDALADAAASQTVRMVAPARLHPHPRNPRKAFGDLAELRDSIASKGILQPVTVVPHPERDGDYLVLLGHCRTECARDLALPFVPVLVRGDLTDEADQIEAMLVENIQRSDLTVLEEGQGFLDLTTLGVKRSAIAERTGRAPSTVTQRMKVASLPESFHAAVLEHQVTLEEAAGFADLPERDADTFASALKAIEKGKEPSAALRDALSKAKTRELKARAEKLAAEHGFGVTMKNAWDISPKASMHDLGWTAAEHHTSGCDGGLVCTALWSIGADTFEGLGQQICTKPENHAERIETVRTERRQRTEQANTQRVESDEERERREAREQLDKDIADATEGRRAWVSTLFLPSAQHVGPMRAALQEYATAIIREGEFTAQVTIWGDDIADQVLADSVHGPERLAVLAILSAVEEDMPTGSWGWKNLVREDYYYGETQESLAKYLSTLRDTGYELTTVEADLLATLEAITSEDADADEDEA